jgi:molybdopterin converting factor subunit 1
MKITVKAFASVKDMLGFNEREFELQSDLTVGDAVKFISEKFDNLKALEENLLFAVNEEYCRGDRKLRENDILALFPPVSGG